jgi:hypothetical protein
MIFEEAAIGASVAKAREGRHFSRSLGAKNAHIANSRSGEAARGVWRGV